MSSSASSYEFEPDGARWARIDLHLHSPGASTFHSLQGADHNSAEGRQQVAAAYVAQLTSVGISVGAITDYNGIRTEWFVPIRDEAAKQGIEILPGAELYFSGGKSGLHVLAIFPRDTDLDAVNSFLRAQDRDPTKALFVSEESHRAIDAKGGSIADILEELQKKFRGLIIFPHPTQESGLIRSLQPKDAAALVRDTKPDAIEHCAQADLLRLSSTSIVSTDFLRSIALVEFSDPKKIDDIGTKKATGGVDRATYVKLSSFEIEALRLALHDPETRVVIGEAPPVRHPRIKRMTVSGAGFLHGIDIKFADDLTTLIGGRGVGKSAVVEVLRYALGEDPRFDDRYRGELIRHALGSGGVVDVVLERPLGAAKSQTYAVRRVYGEAPRITDIESGQLVNAEPAELLGPNAAPIIFGQREIYAVSEDATYRLKLLDDLIGEEVRHSHELVQKAKADLTNNSGRLAEAEQRALEFEDAKKQLDRVSHEIGVYEKHRAADKLREARALAADSERLQGATEVAAAQEKLVTEELERARSKLLSTRDDLNGGTSANQAVLRESAELFESTAEKLNSVQQSISAHFRELRSRLGELEVQWKDLLRQSDEQIRQIKQEAQAESLDADHLIELERQRTRLNARTKDLSAAKAEVEALQEERKALLNTARDQRLRENHLRQQRAREIEGLVDNRLKLTVNFKGAKSDYRDRLTALLRGSSVSGEAIAQLVAPDGTDGISLADAIRLGVDQVRKIFSVTPIMAERVVGWFSANPDKLSDLETLIPDDTLGLALNVDGTYRGVERLSAGQRATSVLLLVFAMEGRVLVLDQPEDDLDNRFIHDDVVQIIREQKGLVGKLARRQIIAATHNANIPVLGDAELVVTMDESQGAARILSKASIDDPQTREHIKSVMEGGAAAFLRRAEKYGGVPSVASYQ